MDRLGDLNERQREAVRTLSGPLLILAGAGTGKTRVITHRAVELIRAGTPPERILSVTFTNKAAREMRERSAHLLAKFRRGSRHRPLATTFHSLCVRILREEAPRLGYPAHFSIYDRGDQESAARAALREIRVTDQVMRPADLVRRISRWKSEGVAPADAAHHVQNDADHLAAMAYRKYQQALKSRGGVDFDDLLLLTHQLFRDHPDVLARHQARYDHLQIDEYQDTNGIQFSLVEAIVRRHRSVCVVGDDDQSIYGWRGAQMKHILEFERIFPGTKVIRLEQNYRSCPAILALANRLAANNAGRHEKRLQAARPDGGSVQFQAFDDEQSEAAGVMGDIAAHLRAGTVRPADVAILFRTNEQPRLFEAEARRLRIPYVLVGGQSFYDRREIRDLLAYLKVLSRPEDEPSLLRILNTPARGIGDASVEKLLTRAVRSGRGLWDVLPEARDAGEIPTRVCAALNDLRSLLEAFRAEFHAPGVDLAAAYSRLVAEIGYEAEIARIHKEPGQQQTRLAAIDQLREAIDGYSRRADSPSLSGFLDDCALDGRAGEPERDSQPLDDGVRMMTLHSAKGLEFSRVYLVGLEEGLLPHRHALEVEGNAIAEERRLAYVGITRAMDDLTVTWAVTRTKWGKPRPSLISRFVYEMRGEDAAALTEPSTAESGDAPDADAPRATAPSSIREKFRRVRPC